MIKAQGIEVKDLRDSSAGLYGYFRVVIDKERIKMQRVFDSKKAGVFVASNLVPQSLRSFTKKITLVIDSISPRDLQEMKKGLIDLNNPETKVSYGKLRTDLETIPASDYSQPLSKKISFKLFLDSLDRLTLKELIILLKGKTSEEKAKIIVRAVYETLPAIEQYEDAILVVS